MTRPGALDELFAAARDDAPSSIVRDEVWGKIAGATAAPAAALGTGVVVKSLLPATTKLAAALAVVGIASAAVTALALGFGGGDVATTTAPSRRVPAVAETGRAGGARLAETAPRGRAEIPAPTATLVPPVRADEAAPIDDASSLAEEAWRVREARAALVQGDAARALALAIETRSFSVRSLEPEALAIEARALRALGRSDEALATELTLRRRFPGHSLAR